MENTYLSRWSLFRRINVLIRKRIALWLEKRIPPSASVKLDHRRIFIFPTAHGLLFLAVTATLFLAGINYQNNLILALSFLLASLFINGIFATYRNLSGLLFESTGALPVGVGETACFNLKISGPTHTGQALNLKIPGQSVVRGVLDQSGYLLMSLPYVTLRRGWCQPGRFHLETRYPLGLIRAWSWVDLQLTCLVYPRAVNIPTQRAEVEGQGYQEIRHTDGVEDFAELRNYRHGDSPKHIDWKVFAKGGELFTKQYQGLSGDSNWIDWHDWPQIDQENCLSAMTYRILTHAESQDIFGLRLPNLEIPPDMSKIQVMRALKAVALFGLVDGDSDIG